MIFRPLDHTILGKATSDGAGVKLTRLLTNDLQQRLDPFLMLDYFGSDNPNDYIAGFPDHPHRGFETITYMLCGRMRHRDSAGHEGLLQAGGVQWMTAGRGIIHSEIPEQTQGRMAGFQLWLNLPAIDKMNPPWYRDFEPTDLPTVQVQEGVQVIVIAGEYQGVSGAVQRQATQVQYWAVHLEPLSTLTHALPASHNSFIVPYEGSVAVGESQSMLGSGQLGLLGSGDGVLLHNPTLHPCRLMLASGQPLKEPIVQYGPFVMNTQAQIMQAFEDYRAGRLGLS